METHPNHPSKIIDATRLVLRKRAKTLISLSKHFLSPANFIHARKLLVIILWDGCNTKLKNCIEFQSQNPWTFAGTLWHKYDLSPVVRTLGNKT